MPFIGLTKIKIKYTGYIETEKKNCSRPINVFFGQMDTANRGANCTIS